MDFIMDNLPWLISIVVFFVMAIIGYYAEKTGYTKKIKFRRDKELPAFDVDENETLENVEEFEETPAEENYVENEFNDEFSTEKIAEKLLAQAERDELEPDIRDLTEEELAEENAEYEYIEVDDENVDVLYQVVDPNGEYDPNTGQTLNPIESVEDYKPTTLMEEYDAKIKSNLENKKLFSDDTGYLEKENADQLFTLLKQYERHLKPHVMNQESTDNILNELIELGALVTSSKTINQETAVRINNLLDHYRDVVTPSITNPRDLSKLLNNIENYKKYINSKTIISTDTSVYNLLELYVKNISENLVGKEPADKEMANRVLIILKQYEHTLRPLVPQSKITDDILSEIVVETNVIMNEEITLEGADHLIELFSQYEEIVIPVITDKKESKQLATLLEECRKYVTTKKEAYLATVEPEVIPEVAEETSTEELPIAENAIYTLLEQYDAKIKPNIEIKKLFGNTTGFIDKKYANNLLDLINGYEKDIKPNVKNDKEANGILSELVDYCSNITSANITDEQVDRILEMVEKYEKFVEENVTDEEKLEEILKMLNNFKEYLITLRDNAQVNEKTEVASQGDTLSAEYTNDIINLLDQYEKYIKPFILNKRLFGEDTGFIDKKYANNMLDLITEYEKDIKPLLEDTTETDAILNELIEYGSEIDFNNLTRSQANKLTELLDKYEDAIRRNISDEKRLSKVKRLLDKNKNYINTRSIIEDVEVPVEATETVGMGLYVDNHATVINPEIENLSEESKIDMILDMVRDKDAVQPVVAESIETVEEEIMPVVIPKKDAETVEEVEDAAPVVIPSKKKFSKELALQATNKAKKNKKKSKKSKVTETDNTDEIIDIIKSDENIEVPVIEAKGKKKSKSEEPVVIEVKNEEIPVIKPKDKKKSKKVEVVEEKETENTNTGVDNIIGIIKDSSVNEVQEELAASVPTIEKSNISKTNRNKKKKENRLKREQRKLERLGKLQGKTEETVIEEQLLDKVEVITEEDIMSDQTDNIIDIIKESSTKVEEEILVTAKKEEEIPVIKPKDKKKSKKVEEPEIEEIPVIAEKEEEIPVIKPKDKKKSKKVEEPEIEEIPVIVEKEEEIPVIKPKDKKKSKKVEEPEIEEIPVITEKEEEIPVIKPKDKKKSKKVEEPEIEEIPVIVEKEEEIPVIKPKDKKKSKKVEEPEIEEIPVITEKEEEIPVIKPKDKKKSKKVEEPEIEEIPVIAEKEEEIPVIKPKDKKKSKKVEEPEIEEIPVIAEKEEEIPVIKPKDKKKSKKVEEPEIEEIPVIMSETKENLPEKNENHEVEEQNFDNEDFDLEYDMIEAGEDDE